MQEQEQLTTETLAVQGVDVIGADDSKGARFAGPFYSDELELLRKTVRALRPSRERFVVAPDGGGVSVYWRATK